MQTIERVTLSEVLDELGVQSRIARSVGVTRSSVQQWLSGKTVPSGPRLVALTDYLRRYVPSATEREVLVELERRRAQREAARNGSGRPKNEGASGSAIP